VRRGVGPPGARDRILRFVASSRRIVLGRRCTLLVGKCGISIHYSVSQRRVNSNWLFVHHQQGGGTIVINFRFGGWRQAGAQICDFTPPFRAPSDESESNCATAETRAALPAIPRPSPHRGTEYTPPSGAYTRYAGTTPYGYAAGVHQVSENGRYRVVQSVQCKVPSPVPITSDRASANRGAAQRAGAWSVRATPGSRSPQKSSI